MPPPQTDYSRLTGTIFSPDRLRNISAVIVGAGALGNEVARILGLLGAAHVHLIDPDSVEPANLTRSVLFRLQDFTGRNKAEALAAASATIFPDTHWDHQPVAMADAGLAPLMNADIIFSCVDSDLARIEIALCALKLNKPVIDGGLGAEGDAVGRIALYAGRQHACYACQLLPEPRAHLLATHFQKRNSCTHPETHAGTPIPSTPALASIVGSFQVDRAIRHLAHPPLAPQSRSLELRIENDDVQLTSLTITRDPLCPLHNPEGTPICVPDPSITFKKLLDIANASQGAVLLDWPVCTAARCLGCGHSWSPMRRLGFLRAAAADCPQCGAQNWIAFAAISAVDALSPYAGQPLKNLGLPANHILHCLRACSPRPPATPHIESLP